MAPINITRSPSTDSTEPTLHTKLVIGLSLEDPAHNDDNAILTMEDSPKSDPEESVVKREQPELGMDSLQVSNLFIDEDELHHDTSPLALTLNERTTDSQSSLFSFNTTQSNILRSQIDADEELARSLQAEEDEKQHRNRPMRRGSTLECWVEDSLSSLGRRLSETAFGSWSR